MQYSAIQSSNQNSNIINIANVDRRHYQVSEDNLWDRLTLAQQFSAGSLGQLGYKLCFIRHVNHSALAILKLGNEVATISIDGQINISKSLKFRD
jgi:hypothetical protein